MTSDSRTQADGTRMLSCNREKEGSGGSCPGTYVLLSGSSTCYYIQLLGRGTCHMAPPSHKGARKMGRQEYLENYHWQKQTFTYLTMFSFRTSRSPESHSLWWGTSTPLSSLFPPHPDNPGLPFKLPLWNLHWDVGKPRLWNLRSTNYSRHMVLCIVFPFVGRRWWKALPMNMGF